MQVNAKCTHSHCVRTADTWSNCRFASTHKEDPSQTMGTHPTYLQRKGGQIAGCTQDGCPTGGRFCLLLKLPC